MNPDNIRERLKKKKLEEEDARKQIADGFMNGIQKLMWDFNKKVDTNQITIKDPNDLYKLFVIYQQMQQLSDTGEGNSALPELTNTQAQVFDELKDESTDEEGNIDLERLSELSADDITQMIAEKEKIMNEENSDTF